MTPTQLLKEQIKELRKSLSEERRKHSKVVSELHELKVKNVRARKKRQALKKEEQALYDEDMARHSQWDGS